MGTKIWTLKNGRLHETDNVGVGRWVVLNGSGELIGTLDGTRLDAMNLFGMMEEWVPDHDDGWHMYERVC